MSLNVGSCRMPPKIGTEGAGRPAETGHGAGEKYARRCVRHLPLQAPLLRRTRSCHSKATCRAGCAVRCSRYAASEASAPSRWVTASLSATKYW